jgi:PAS domain S-box-containing protein
MTADADLPESVRRRLEELTHRAETAEEALRAVRAGEVDRREKARRSPEEEDGERYRALADNSPDLIVRYDRELRLLYANPAVVRRTARAADALLGRTAREFGAAPASAAAWERAARRVLETGEPERFEHTSFWQGQTRTYDTVVVPERGADGAVTAVMAVARDITEKREGGERLKLAQQIAHLGSWELDLASNQLSWSDEVYRIFGLEPQAFEATYDAFLDAVHPEDRAAVDGAYSSSLRDGRDDYEIEHRVVRRADGQVRVVHEKCKHLRDESGRVVRSVGMVHDITERKRMEEALKRQQAELELRAQQMQALFDYTVASLALFDAKPPYRVLAHNKYYQELWREPFRSRGMVGKTLPEYVPDVEAAGVMAIYHEVAETKRGKTLLSFPYDGLPRGRTWWNWHLSPVMQGDEVVALAHMGIDVTDEVTAREALRETRDYLESLFNYANAPIIVWDPSSRITRFNRAFERLTGYQAAEVIGQELRLLFPEATREASLAKIERTAEGEHWESVEIPIRRKDGEVRLALWNSANLRTEDGTRIIATIAQGQDITQRKQMEVERERHLAAVAEANEAKDVFFNTLSHELRTPLAAMLNAVEVLKNPEVKAHHARVVDLLERNVRQQTRLIDDLLDLSRIIRGKVEIVRKPLDLRQLVAAQVEGVEASARSARLALELRASEQPLSISADPERLGQVISNLLTNAIKYTEPGGAIRVTIAAEGDQATVRVKDTGIGIESELLPHVFEAFRQAETSLGRSKGGLGIGLAVARSLAELHGGTLAGFSEGLGRGSEFVLRLPLGTTLAGSAGARDARPGAARAAGRGQRGPPGEHEDPPGADGEHRHRGRGRQDRHRDGQARGAGHGADRYRPARHRRVRGGAGAPQGPPDEEPSSRRADGLRHPRASRPRAAGWLRSAPRQTDRR